MDLRTLIQNNLLTPPILCFFAGILLALFRPKSLIPSFLSKLLAIALLFIIGLKGGAPMLEHFDLKTGLFLGILGLWGLFHPLLSFLLLRLSTNLDKPTACAISASFGSISVMTFVAGTTFLENLQIEYQKMALAAAALMEVPGIISGMVLAKKTARSASSQSYGSLLKETFLNKTILALLAGLVLSALASLKGINSFLEPALWGFKPLLCLFLLDMGQRVALFWKRGPSFSLPLALFGIYMPLLGAASGILLSHAAGLEKGTTTLIALLLASASYIAAPAAMRIAVPEAKESIYLPLALGVTFPFNVLVGIPLYYQMAGYLIG